ncbi:MAG: threonine synthase [bacterium]
MTYYSTNLSSPDVDLRGALLGGQAPDKGLYMPRELPHIPVEEIRGYKNEPYPVIAFNVLRRFTAGLVLDDELWTICHECYNYPVPLDLVRNNLWLLRLDRGPTASFKDFAARMMARLMRYFLHQEGGRLTILTATSGDTGSAVAHAFHNVDGIAMVVLFPAKEVSDRQRRQMTTLGGNVRVAAIDGKFDDCQALVKRAFADPDLKRIRFSSANSINIGRLLPQSVYYFYAWAKLQKSGETAVFSVPSGNFGDMCGGMLAWRMGLPVERFVIATNSNDEFPRFLATERYERVDPSRVCISNAMNVGHPSNLPRLVALYGGQMDEKGHVSRQPDFTALRADIYPASVDDTATRASISDTWQKYRVLLEPHGAVGWAALERYCAEAGLPRLGISIETAHPAKFPEEIVRLTGVEPELPPSLEGLDERPEHYDHGPNDYQWFKDYLLKAHA